MAADNPPANRCNDPIIPHHFPVLLMGLCVLAVSPETVKIRDAANARLSAELHRTTSSYNVSCPNSGWMHRSRTGIVARTWLTNPYVDQKTTRRRPVRPALPGKIYNMKGTSTSMWNSESQLTLLRENLCRIPYTRNVTDPDHQYRASRNVPVSSTALIPDLTPKTEWSFLITATELSMR